MIILPAIESVYVVPVRLQRLLSVVSASRRSGSTRLTMKALARQPGGDHRGACARRSRDG